MSTYVAAGVLFLAAFAMFAWAARNKRADGKAEEDS